MMRPRKVQLTLNGEKSDEAWMRYFDLNYNRLSHSPVSFPLSLYLCFIFSVSDFLAFCFLLFSLVSLSLGKFSHSSSSSFNKVPVCSSLLLLRKCLLVCLWIVFVVELIRVVVWSGWRLRLLSSFPFTAAEHLFTDLWLLSGDLFWINPGLTHCRWIKH